MRFLTVFHGEQHMDSTWSPANYSIMIPPLEIHACVTHFPSLALPNSFSRKFIMWNRTWNVFLILCLSVHKQMLLLILVECCYFSKLNLCLWLWWFRWMEFYTAEEWTTMLTLVILRFVIDTILIILELYVSSLRLSYQDLNLLSKRKWDMFLLHRSIVSVLEYNTLLFDYSIRFNRLYF